MSAPEYVNILKLFKLCGYHPDCSNFHRKCNLIFGILLYGIFTYLAIKGVVVYLEEDLVTSLECLQTSFLSGDCLVRHVVIHLNRENLDKLLKITKKHDFPQRARKIIRSYFLLCVVSALGFIIQPAFTGQLPTTVYIPQGTFWLLFLSMIVTGMSVTVVFVINDCLFCFLCSSAIAQFNNLEKEFKTLDFSRGKIEGLVRQHCRAIYYCQILNSNHGGIFLSFFVFSIGAICMQIYTSTNREIPLGLRIKNLVFCTAQITESVLYCSFCEILSNKTEDVTTVVYNLDWQNCKLTPWFKCLILIMQRSQKKIVFGAFGFINIHMNTFVIISKTAMSFYTYLTSIGN